jgi:hypothetical protein
MFVAFYLSLLCAFLLGIYTLSRTYERFFAVVENSALSDYNKAGCHNLRSMSDISYQLFTITFGDNMMSALTPGRDMRDNFCGGIMVTNPAAQSPVPCES